MIIKVVGTLGLLAGLHTNNGHVVIKHDYSKFYINSRCQQGRRDYYNGGYIEPESLQLKLETIKWINEWVCKYEDEHYNEFKNLELVKKLDQEGKDIAVAIKKELGDIKISYYSARVLSTVIIH